jgi:hypothetical protein
MPVKILDLIFLSTYLIESSTLMQIRKSKFVTKFLKNDEIIHFCLSN